MPSNLNSVEFSYFATPLRILFPRLESRRRSGYLGSVCPPCTVPARPMLFPRYFLAAVFVSLLLTGELAAETTQYQIEISPGDLARNRLPVCVDVTVPEGLAKATVATAKLANGTEIPCQVTQPNLLHPPMHLRLKEVHRQIWCVPEMLEAGTPVTLKVTISDEQKPTEPLFSWTNTSGKYADLAFGGRLLLRYMYEPLDDSNEARRGETYKVYHHIFDPSGKQLLTKGPGGLFPHHRGLFFGFNRISYDGGKKADTWHCTGKAHQSHMEFVSEEAGPVLGRHVVKVGWHGQDGEVFAEEERELTVYRQPMEGDRPIGTLIEFASILRTTGSEIKLDGDPQHSGVQFRASQEVPDKTKGQTYYLRTTGIGKPGEYRNWPDQKDQVNFPWKGMSAVIGDRRYTVANLDRPENPKESRFSERDYGRFGSYFVYTVTPEKPLRLNYRFWVQPGEMTTEQIDALAKDFTTPVRVTVKQL